MDFQSKSRRTVILWLSYSLLAIILTWPTVMQIATHLPGDGGDDPAIAWNIWWVKYALLSEGQDPFQSDFMFYPIGINLAFYTLTLLNGATVLPLTLNFGVVPASNLHMFFTLVCGAYGTFLLIRYSLTTSFRPGAGPHYPTVKPKTRQILMNGDQIWLSAALGGGFYAFASSKLFYIALGQFNIASNQWVPFAVLYILRTCCRPSNKNNAVMAGLFLSLQAWAEMTYFSFLLVFIALYWLYGILDFRLWIFDFKAKVRLYLPSMLAMGLTFTLGILPILAHMLPDMWREGDFLVEGGGFADVFSADLLGFLVPTLHHPFWGGLISRTNISTFDKGQHIYLGYILLALTAVAILTVRRQSAVRFWLIAAAVFALLSLGPIITIDGQSTGIDGPFRILQSLPLFKGNRYPSRYSVMLILSLSVLASFGLVQVSRWTNRLTGGGSLKSNGPFIIITALFLLEHLSLPLPQSNMQIPIPYQIIAADPETFSVLDIPFAWRNGFRITGAPTTQFMFGQFYQTAHQKRLLQGNTSRNPALKFQYFTRAPIINSLLALETGKQLPPERWEADRAVAAAVLHFFNIKYIVVRPDNAGNPIVVPQATIPYIEDIFPVNKIHDDVTLKIYRVTAPFNPPQPDQPSNVEPASDFTVLIRSASPLAPLYFGEGWGLLNPGHPLTAQRKKVRLLLPLAAGPQSLTVRMRLPDAVNTASRSVHVTLNGWRSSSHELSKVWQEYSFELPVSAVQPGLNDVWLHFDTISPLPRLQPDTVPLDVTVLSAGEEVGDFGHIFVNGHDISPNQRGYNVALIRPGGLWQVANFDTHLDRSASDALVNFIDRVPTNTLIALAAADEASANLSEQAALALQSIGAVTNLRGCFRCGHALIHSDETVIEASALLEPVGITTNLGLTEPAIAAVIDWIRVNPLKP